MKYYVADGLPLPYFRQHSAISRPKILELVWKEKAGEGAKGEPELICGIVSPSDEDVDLQKEYMHIQDGCASQRQWQVTSGLDLQALSQVYSSAIDVDDASRFNEKARRPFSSPPLFHRYRRLSFVHDGHSSPLSSSLPSSSRSLLLESCMSKIVRSATRGDWTV